ncbi:proline-rich protein 15-like [Heteronotia binoei]|uniref:proline-rich protein 15-like n=1 Tax=Heteronotia binoei TaxID=13085 RepID=UPI00292EF22B|nr:proline-rich protein 15-like [Heteronotia binoei]
MAESTAAAPSSGKGSSSGPWWKSLTSRRKPKEAPSAAPGASRPPPDPSEPPFASPSASDSLENQQPCVGTASRRNLKVSRSGRFKEKRKVCATLLAPESPQQLFKGAGGSSATATLPAEETPCQ